MTEKERLLIEIEADGKYCGDCYFKQCFNRSGLSVYECVLFENHGLEWGRAESGVTIDLLRCSVCIGAEARLHEGRFYTRSELKQLMEDLKRRIAELEELKQRKLG
jgi:hypothetical protein